jgi:hypothetical protein
MRRTRPSIFAITLRPICWLFDHTWQITRWIPGCWVGLFHLHPLAACDAYCTTCGKEWKDVDDHMATHAAIEPRNFFSSPPCSQPQPYAPHNLINKIEA